MEWEAGALFGREGKAGDRERLRELGVRWFVRRQGHFRNDEDAAGEREMGGKKKKKGEESLYESLSPFSLHSPHTRLVQLRLERASMESSFD